MLKVWSVRQIDSVGFVVVPSRFRKLLKIEKSRWSAKCWTLSNAVAEMPTAFYGRSNPGLSLQLFKFRLTESSSVCFCPYARSRKPQQCHKAVGHCRDLYHRDLLMWLSHGLDYVKAHRRHCQSAKISFALLQMPRIYVRRRIQIVSFDELCKVLRPGEVGVCCLQGQTRCLHTNPS